MSARPRVPGSSRRPSGRLVADWLEVALCDPRLSDGAKLDAVALGTLSDANGTVEATDAEIAARSEAIVAKVGRIKTYEDFFTYLQTLMRGEWG
jgi:hypothetical protein